MRACPGRCLPVTPAQDYSVPMTAAFEKHFRTLLSMDNIMQMQEQMPERQDVGAIRCVPRAHDVAI